MSGEFLKICSCKKLRKQNFNWSHLYLCFTLNHAAGSAFKRPDLEIVTTGILCRNRYQLQFTCQLVVLCQLQLCLEHRRLVLMEKKRKRKNKNKKNTDTVFKMMMNV